MIGAENFLGKEDTVAQAAGFEEFLIEIFVEAIGLDAEFAQKAPWLLRCNAWGRRWIARRRSRLVDDRRI